MNAEVVSKLKQLKIKDFKTVSIDKSKLEIIEKDDDWNSYKYKDDSWTEWIIELIKVPKSEIDEEEFVEEKLNEEFNINLMVKHENVV